ncbi:MAG: hypothetical protein HRU78_04315 [Gammaproteobacteria bacterium]|nr:MAG: hypothetical protein HRU78_04315 [Gammaproteobacteria bacterium]
MIRKTLRAAVIAFLVSSSLSVVASTDYSIKIFPSLFGGDINNSGQIVGATYPEGLFISGPDGEGMKFLEKK